MRRLYPPPATADSAEDREWTLAELAEAYAYPDPRPGGAADRTAWLRANMVASADGAAHHGGRSQPLSGAADMRVFGVLRALADVIVVGAETVRREEYRPAKRRADFAARRARDGQAPVAAIAVVSASLRLDFGAPLFTSPLVPTLVLTGGDAPGAGVAAARAAGAEVVVAGEGSAVDPLRAKRELAARGYTRMLTEGGPRLLAQFAAAGALDELCLTTSPRLAAGTAERVMHGPGLPVPQELALTSLLEDAGFLFARYQRA